jgi:hypothetical protein
VIPHVASTDIDRVLDRFGPTPRLCIDFLLGGYKLKSRENDVLLTISHLTVPQIEQMLLDASSLTMDLISDKIWLIRRENVHETLGRTVVMPMTPFIQS